MSGLPIARAVGLTVGVWLVYGQALGGGFHYDDFHSLVFNPHLRDLGNIGAFFTEPGLFSVDPNKAMYRPLVLVSYALNYAWGQYSPAGYLFVNISIHLTNVLLVWSIGRRLGLSENGSLWAAVLFCFHPLVGEPINYVSSRSESLAVAGQLAAFYFYLQTGRRWWPWLSWGALLCALLAKSIAAVLPAVLLAYEVLWRGQSVSWRRHAPYWVITGAYIGVISANRFLGTSLSNAPRGLYEQLLTQGKALVYYAYLLAEPVHLSVEHPFSVSNRMGVEPLLALGAVVSLVVVALVQGDRRLRFFLCWGGLSLLPTVLVPLNVLVNEHRLYMLVAVMSIALGMGWERWERPVRWSLCVWVIVAGMLSHQRIAVWRDELSLWQDAAHKGPHMVRPQVFLGNAWRAAGDYPAARAAYERALELDPHHRSARTNLANVYLEAAGGDQAQAPLLLERAERHYRQVLDSDPSYREALTNLGSLYMLRGEWTRADGVLSAAIEQHPYYADGYFNLGLVRVELGDSAAAVALFKRALALDEGAEIWYELANAHARLDQLDAAAAAYRQALSRDRAVEGALYNLAEVLLVAGERAGAAAGDARGIALWREAGEALEELLERDPRHVRANQRLDQLRERMP